MTLDQLTQAVRHLHPNAVSTTKSNPRDKTKKTPNWKAEADAHGDASIVKWSPRLGPQPTVEQLAVALPAATLVQVKKHQHTVLEASFNRANEMPVTVDD